MTPIDLGLPSGTKWAPMNVGASAPEQAGLYFSWGNTQGHTPGDGYEFTETAYNNTPGSEVSGQLPLANDAARVNMGGSWRLPTKTEFLELVNNCTYQFISRNDVNGVLFTSNINGNSIFIPASGNIDGDTLDGFNEYGLYWSATVSDQANACCLNFDDGNPDPESENPRYVGFTLRAVQS